MNQRRELQIKCSIGGHEYLQQACLNQSCKAIRIQCQQCLQNGDHVAHNQDQKNMNQLVQFFHSIEEISEISINKLSQMITQINELYTQIKQELRIKYQLSFQRLSTLNSNQLNTALNEIISYDQNEISVQQETKQFLDKIINLFKEWIDRLNKQKQEKLELLYSQGCQLYFDYRKYQEAIQLFDDALLINPRHFNSLYLKSGSLKELGNYNDAIIWADKALSVDSKHVLSVFTKADSLKELGNYNDAIIWADKALYINSKHVLSLYTKGDSLRMLKKYDEAIKNLNQALDYNPNHYQSLGSKGACLQSLQKYQEAISYYNKAIEINPYFTLAKNNKVECENKLNTKQRTK